MKRRPTIARPGRLRLVFALITVGLSSCFSSEDSPHQVLEGNLLISGVQIIDVAAGDVSPPRDILIGDRSILEVAEKGSISTERASSIIAGDGLFVLPGLINVHAHIGNGGLGAQSEGDRIAALAQFVRYGVTTIFVPGGGGGNDHQLTRWKQRCSSRELLCPGLYGSGALITAPGSHPIGTIWNLPGDVDPAVVYERGAIAISEGEPVGPLLDRKVEMGVDAIKIVIEDGIGPRYPMPRLSKAKVAELTREAHNRGLRVFAHVSMPDHVEDSVAAGVDGVMHSVENPLTDSVLAQMSRQGTFYVATLSLYDGFFDLAHGRVEQESYAKAGASQKALDSLEGFRGTPFQTPEEARPVEIAIRDNLRRAMELGVPLALGTDVNNPGVFPGYSAHEELALMVEAGLTPAEALASATVGGASFLNREQSLGRVAPGYEADLLILTRNPLENIENTRRIYAVVRDGELVDSIVSEAARIRSRRSPNSRPRYP